MSLETEAAKAGVKFTWAGVKLIAFVIGLGLLCGLLWHTASRIATLQAENANLTEFRDETKKQQEVSAQASASFARATAADTSREVEQDHTYTTQQTATRAAANEDVPTADFLRAPIPKRLRDADRQARAAARRDGGLDEGEGARRPAD